MEDKIWGLRVFLTEKGVTGVKFEFTSPRTPQQNRVVERTFGYLYGKIRESLHGTMIEGGFRKKLWAECGNNLTVMDNATVKEKKKSNGEVC